MKPAFRPGELLIDKGVITSGERIVVSGAFPAGKQAIEPTVVIKFQRHGVGMTAHIGQAEVMGTTATFRFPIKAPAKPGGYKLVVSADGQDLCTLEILVTTH